MNEVWKYVVGYENSYEVSNFGRVRNCRTGKMKKPTPDPKDGRLRLMLWNNNTYKLFKIHRLVLIAFRGHPKNGMECCHNDGNPKNNNLKNLRWDTAANNQADRVKHQTSNRGEQSANAKLTAEQILAIRKDNRLQRIIAKEYGILQNHVSRIKNKVRWSHI